MKLGSVHDVYVNELANLRSFETQLIEAIPEMAAAAHDARLARAFSEHLAQTERHLARLEEIIGSSLVEVPSNAGEAMRSLISEIRRIIQTEGPGEVKDVALIAEAQRIEHCEIATYGTARALADQLDLRSAVELLSETLEEEARIDELFTKLATGGLIVSGLNERAQDGA